MRLWGGPGTSTGLAAYLHYLPEQQDQLPKQEDRYLAIAGHWASIASLRLLIDL